MSKRVNRTKDEGIVARSFVNAVLIFLSSQVCYLKLFLGRMALDLLSMWIPCHCQAVE